tara:strand:- start:3212 stop:3709 length:498 start_codon:yes stop_codon:yes gene_type:complete
MNIDDIIDFLFISILLLLSFTMGFFVHIVTNLPPPRLKYDNSSLVTGTDIQDYLSMTNYIVYDKMYSTLSLNFTKKFLKLDDTDLYNYQLDKFDCDNYAILLMSRFIEYNYHINIPYNFAIGLCNQKTHVINWFIDNEMKIRCIEPQNDTIFSCDILNMCDLIII